MDIITVKSFHRIQCQSMANWINHCQSPSRYMATRHRKLSLRLRQARRLRRHWQFA